LADSLRFSEKAITFGLFIYKVIGAFSKIEVTQAPCRDGLQKAVNKAQLLEEEIQ
jgi:hypothetical protein